MSPARTILKGFVLLVLAFGLVGCDAFEDINPFNNEKEVTGIVEAVGESSLTVDGIEYRVTDSTEFDDGYSSLADVSVGDEVEIEYEEEGGGRRALEVEPADGD